MRSFSTDPAAVLRRFMLPALALLAMALPAHAQTVAAKIGVFDKQRVVDESKLGTAAKDRFEKLQTARQVEVTEKQKAFEALQKAYDQQSAVLSDEKKLERQRELARSHDEYQSSAENADRDLQRAYQQALMEIVQKLDPLVLEFAKTDGYDILFDQTQIAFAKDGFDVTDKIIAKVNAAFPTGVLPKK